MSADNWALCPKCAKNFKPEDKPTKRELLAKAEESYGKVSPEEYKKLVREANDYVEQTEPDYTFREDFEQGMDECGVYSVSYHGLCDTCGFKHVYNFEEKVKI